MAFLVLVLVSAALCLTTTRADLPDYREAEAVLFANYASASFCTKEAIETWTCGPTCEHSEVVPGKVVYLPEVKPYEVQGFVAQIPHGRCVVAFRGSVNADNWYADFKAFKKPWPPTDTNRSGAPWCRNCTAHMGFAGAYESLRPPVIDALSKLGCASVAVTGHSLGAAVATLAAFDLSASLQVHVDAVWTFGKPRLGNYAFVDSFMAEASRVGRSPPLWRVVHYHDPVPRAPPDVYGVYEVAHEPFEVYYTDRESSNYIQCPQDGHVENSSSTCAAGFPLPLCVNMDHVTYLNISFAHKTLSEECTGAGESSIVV